MCIFSLISLPRSFFLFAMCQFAHFLHLYTAFFSHLVCFQLYLIIDAICLGFTVAFASATAAAAAASVN